jgi:hypothetical protein
MVIATDQAGARAYAKALREITGEAPTVVLSDDAGASTRIEAFAAGIQRWMVAVRMVSEGVDVPRLAVGVYATSTSTPLFFSQAVGRFVRMRRRGETASIFLPSLPALLDLAAQLEVERDHALERPARDGEWNPEEALVAAAEREEKASGDLERLAFEALGSQATFDRVLFDKQEFGTRAEVGSEEEQDFLGIPGLLEPDQVSTLLRQRQAAQQAKGRPASNPPGTAAAVAAGGHRRITAMRKELHGLVGAWAKRTGQPHGAVHSSLRQVCGGPDVPQAGIDQLQARIDTLRRWFVGRK